MKFLSSFHNTSTSIQGIWGSTECLLPSPTYWECACALAFGVGGLTLLRSLSSAVFPPLGITMDHKDNACKMSTFMDTKVSCRNISISQSAQISSLQQETPFLSRVLDVLMTLMVEFISLYCWFGPWVFVDQFSEKAGIDFETSAWMSWVSQSRNLVSNCNNQT